MIIGNETTIAFDVDDTLIMWDEDSYKPAGPGRVPITCPWDNRVTSHIKHWRHCEFLKKQHAKGFTVIVWSSSGAAWAATVVKALGLEQYVTACLSKPIKYVDDLPNPADILGIHIYLGKDGHSI